MDGHGEIDTWRRDRLADEPLYCSVPDPIDPEDIICYGSDEELDDAAKVAKRLRYEEQGLRYLRGKPIRLLSASLRGPFDKHAGWKNPWLPKTSAAKPSSNLPSNLPPKNKKSTHPIKDVTPTVKKRFPRLCAVPNNITGDTGDTTTTPITDTSMQCQLPSPESNRGVDAGPAYLDSEQHNRIQAWAKGVATRPLTKDQFWAPERDADEGREDTKKRHATDEWLRKKPTKRNRLNSMQGTGAASTPTPLPAPPMSSNRAKPSSGHVHDIHEIHEIHDIPPSTKMDSSQRCTNNSFELTTPSSSADQMPAKPTAPQPTSHSIHNDMQSTDGSSMPDATTAAAAATKPSASSSNASHVSKIPSIAEPEMEPAHKDNVLSRLRATNNQPTSPKRVPPTICEQEEARPEHNSYPKTSEDDIMVAREEDSHAGEPEDPTLESFADASFHYHARPPKLEGGAEDKPSIEQPGSSEIIQTTILTDHEATSNDVANDTESKCPIPVQTALRLASVGLPAEVDGTVIETGNDAAQPETHDDAEGPIHPGLCKIEGDVSPTHIEGANESVSANSDGEVLVKKEPISYARDTTPVGDGKDPEMSLIQRSLLKRRQIPTEEYDTTGNPVLQLKKMRLEEPSGPEKAGDAPHVENVGVDCATCEPAVDEGSTLVGDSANGSVVGNAMDIDEPCRPTESRELSQPTRLADAKEDSVFKEPSPSAESSKDTHDEMAETGSAIASDGTVLPHSQEEQGIVDEEVPTPQMGPALAPAGLNPGHGPQSPWASHDSQNEPPIKTEPVEDPGRRHPSPSARLGPLRPLKDQQTPAIRASQQSPWMKEVLLPATTETRRQTSKMDISFMIEQTPSPGDIQESSHNKENIPMTMPPTEPTSTIPVPIGGPHGSHSVETTPSLNQKSNQGDLASMAAEALQSTRPRTPEPEISLKSFANFFTPSPIRRSSHAKSRSRKSTGRRPGILVTGSGSTPSNPWSSAKPSSRRVSFAPLQGDDEDGAQDEAAAGPSAGRAASPPPETMIDAEEEDVNDAFRKHFEAVKNRGGGNPPRSHSQQRLPRSLSQRRPASPTDNAPADAVVAADDRDTAMDDTANPPKDSEPQPPPQPQLPTEDSDVDDAEAPQSPWQAQGPSQEVDDVDAVMGNLEQFLDAWDVDTAMKEAAVSPGPGPSSALDNTEADKLLGIGVWD